MVSIWEHIDHPIVLNRKVSAPTFAHWPYNSISIKVRA